MSSSPHPTKLRPVACLPARLTLHLFRGILAWTALILTSGPTGLLAADALESVQRTALEWARMREETLRLQQAWETERKLLEATAAALRERTDRLERQRDLAEAQTATARQRTEEATARSEALTIKIAEVDDRLRGFAAGIERLQPWLPPRLSRALTLPLRSLKNPKLPPAERTQLIATILNRCTQFNSAVTFSEEALELEGNTGERLVEILYWGLAQAFALDRPTGQAYVGRPGSAGWEWSQLPDAGAKVAAAIAAYRDEADPQFVMLPARLVAPPAEVTAAERP